MHRIKVFEELPDQAYSQIVENILWKKYEQDANVIFFKEEKNDVYFLAEGRVRATIFSFSGKEVTYQDLFAGDMFGELSAIDGLPRSTQVVALEPSTIGSMSGTRFWEVVLEHSQVASAVLKRLANLVRFLADRVYQYSALDVKARIRVELLNLAREHMIDDDSARIPDMPKHQEIANRISTHREAVTKELNKLSKLGLIEQKGRVLTIKDVAKLAESLPED